jgi:hypothetical protein
MDEDTRQQPEAPLDDEELGALVRDVADGWRMPPQRLGQRTWRERAADGEAGTGRSGWRRVALPLATALVATIVLAVGVAWIDQLASRPSTGSASPSPAASGASGASPAPGAVAATPAPTLELSAGPLPADRLVVQGNGARIVDLSIGAIGPVLEPTGRGWSLLTIADDGTLTCLCVVPTLGSGGSIDGARVELDRFAAFDRFVAGTSKPISAKVLATYGPGVGDPAISGFGAVAAIELSRGADGLAYVGWTVRDASTWTSGVDVVDVGAGTIVQQVSLPPFAVLTDAVGATTQPTFAWAPVAIEGPGSTSVVIGQVRGRLPSSQDVALPDPTHWSAPLVGGRVGSLTAFATGEGSLDGGGCDPVDEAFVDASTYSVLCRATGKELRVDATGRTVGEVQVPGFSSGSFASSVSAADGTRYIWMPYGHRLVRVDPDGTVRDATVDPTAAGDGNADGLAGLGRDLARLIAPAADAKLYLEPAIALSPDGGHLYLLGSRAGDPYSTAGSTGVIVVDTRDLSVVDRWEPTADFVSIGVGQDGSLVYALGAPGIRQLPSGEIEVSDSVPASLTVFDAASGKVRALAGQLGSDYLRLDPGLMP